MEQTDSLPWGVVIAYPDSTPEQILTDRYATIKEAREFAKTFAGEAAAVLRVKAEDTEIVASRPDPTTGVITISSRKTGTPYFTVRPVMTEPYLKAKGLS
jgi:hypothetical protein